MLSRKEQNENPIYLPGDWKEKVTELLSQVYKRQIEDTDKVFDIYGLTYPNEVVLIVSLLSKVDGAAAPVSFIMSADLAKDKKSDNLFNALIDSVGLFYDDYFQAKDWSDYQAKWEDGDFNGVKFFYIISRENFGLTMAANKLLEEM